MAGIPCPTCEGTGTVPSAGALNALIVFTVVAP